jgi:hypothetical protein
VSHELRDPVGSVEEGVLAVGVEMDECHFMDSVNGEQGNGERYRDDAMRCPVYRLPFTLLFSPFELLPHGIQRNTASLQEHQ